MSNETGHELQVVYWRLLSTMFGLNERGPGFDKITGEVATEVGLPSIILEPGPAIPTLIQRYPELKNDFESIAPGAGNAAALGASAPPITPSPAAPESTNDLDPEQARLRKAIVFSKLLLNALGPNTQAAHITAQQYAQWCDDVGWLEQALGYPPGSLRAQSGKKDLGQSGNTRNYSQHELEAALTQMEGDLVQRMSLKEVLNDPELAEKLNPSMPLIEQLLREKGSLSGVALQNAKRLIRAYVDKLAEVLRLQVRKVAKGKIERSVPPKKVFRNLDLKRTIWKNLTHWDNESHRLYVDQLYYKRTGVKSLPTRLIVVVDQSGSMVDAMVQTTILASIFAGLPNVDVHLIAFDTNLIDLTPWVHDPFEVLLRTNLGGGNDGPRAMREMAMPKILEPRYTAMVWISDFYEFSGDQPLFELIKQVKEMGVHFIPVGALQSSGYFSVNPWFRDKLKSIGLPVLHGSITKLIEQLRYMLPLPALCPAKLLLPCGYVAQYIQDRVCFGGVDRRCWPHGVHLEGRHQRERDR